MFKRTVKYSIIVACVIAFSFSVSADYGTYGSDDPGIDSTISFSAGGTGYSPNKSRVGAYDGEYDVYLSSVKFVGIPTNVFPGSSTLVKLYAVRPSDYVTAGNTASFSSVHGGYSYAYKDGFGGYHYYYKLASKSTYTALGATVGTHWQA